MRGRNDRRLLTWVLSLLALLAVGSLVSACSSSAAQSAALNGNSGAQTKAGDSGFKRTGEAGNVTVVATWENPAAKGDLPITVDVAMDTHSVDLDSYDLSQLAVLRSDLGVEATAEEWKAPKGGHHREGKLVFARSKSGQPIIGPETKGIELVIRDVAGVKERTFRWEVPR